jgi:UDP-perosamine 4-acetyltransferase
MNAKDIVIIGGGGHTRVLIGMAQVAGLSVRGVITSSVALVGTSILDVPVLGLESEFNLSPNEVTHINGVGNAATRAGSGLGPRAELYARYRARGYDFFPCISSAAVVAPHVLMGEGVLAMAGSVIQPGSIIGENVIINTRASVDHDCVIAPHCHIAPAATLCGHVVVGERSHIGAGAVITQGVHIGARVVIGGGAVVTYHVADDCLVRPAGAGRQSAFTVPQ